MEADLSTATFDRCNLKGAIYNLATSLPKDFKPDFNGMVIEVSGGR
jgi:hypothetical protein